MKVLRINTVDNVGGAALNALRLNNEIKKRGIKSYYFVGRKFSECEDIKELSGFINIRFFNKLVDTYKLRDPIFTKRTNLFQQDEYKHADIIHLHNLHSGYFRIENLFRLTKEKPVVWTFHDMWPICGNIPHTLGDEWWVPDAQGNVYPPDILDWWMFNRKKKVYVNSDFRIVVPSLWLYNKVKRSILKNFNITLIHNGIDVDNIYPLNKANIRKKYNIDNRYKVISFIAQGGLKNKWKGGKYMMETISMLGNKYPLIFIEIGTKDKTIVKNDNHWKIPPITDRKILNEYLNLSDVFLFTSIAENFPLSLLEAQSAGVPTVTFDVGGSKEIVLHEKTGFVSKYKDVEDTIKGVQSILDYPEVAKKYSTNARERVLENFTLQNQASQYIKLYEKTLEECNPRALTPII